MDHLGYLYDIAGGILALTLLVLILILPWRTGYSNKKDSDVTYHAALRYKIWPTLQTEQTRESYSSLAFKILTSRSSLDLLKLFKRQPRAFYNTMHDLIQVQIVMESGHIISEKNQDLIYGMRTLETLKGIWKAHHDPNVFKKQMDKVKDICLRDIMHLEAIVPYDDEPSLSDSHYDIVVNKSYFLSILKPNNTIISRLKKLNKGNQVICNDLRIIKSIKNNLNESIELSYNTVDAIKSYTYVEMVPDEVLDKRIINQSNYLGLLNYNNFSNDQQNHDQIDFSNKEITYGEIKDFFELTEISKITNQLTSKQEYNNDTDAFLATSYFNSLNNLSLLHTENKTTLNGPVDVSFLHGLIESRIGMSFKQKGKDNICVLEVDNGDNVEFATRYAPNKLLSTIIGKLSRKENEKNDGNAPWFYNLIKDAMRLSQVFESENDIYAYITKLRKIFGENLDQKIHDSDYDVYIRIKEVKNGFYGFEDKGNYCDLKIIYEYYLNQCDCAIQAECQLNLSNLIKWKVAEHIVYDYIRADDEVNTIADKMRDYEWQEGQVRPTLFMLQWLTALIAFSFIITLTYVFVNTIIAESQLIAHANQKLPNVGFLQGVADVECLYGLKGHINCLGENNEFFESELRKAYTKNGYSKNYWLYISDYGTDKSENHFINVDKNQLISSDVQLYSIEHLKSKNLNKVYITSNYIYSIESDKLTIKKLGDDSQVIHEFDAVDPQGFVVSGENSFCTSDKFHQNSIEDYLKDGSPNLIIQCYEIDYTGIYNISKIGSKHMIEKYEDGDIKNKIKVIEPDSYCLYNSFIEINNKQTKSILYVYSFSEDNLYHVQSCNYDINGTCQLEGDLIISHQKPELSCGYEHSCVIYNVENEVTSKVECFGGSKASNESFLSDEFNIDALAVHAGRNRTCVLKLGRILCNGRPLNKHNKYLLSDPKLN